MGSQILGWGFSAQPQIVSVIEEKVWLPSVSGGSISGSSTRVPSPTWPRA